MPHPTSWRSILILSSHLRLGLPSGRLPLRSPHQNLVCTCLFPHTCEKKFTEMIKIYHEDGN
jgi:hypothetical protein